MPRWDVELQFVRRKEPFDAEAGEITVVAEDYEGAVRQARHDFLRSQAPELSAGEVVRIARVDDPRRAEIRRIPCGIPGCQSLHANGSPTHLDADGRAWIEEIKTSGKTAWDHVLDPVDPVAEPDVKASTSWARILDEE
jgi:hypothetical protein